MVDHRVVVGGPLQRRLQVGRHVRGALGQEPRAGRRRSGLVRAQRGVGGQHQRTGGQSEHGDGCDGTDQDGTARPRVRPELRVPAWVLHDHIEEVRDRDREDGDRQLDLGVQRLVQPDRRLGELQHRPVHKVQRVRDHSQPQHGPEAEQLGRAPRVPGCAADDERRCGEHGQQRVHAGEHSGVVVDGCERKEARKAGPSEESHEGASHPARALGQQEGEEAAHPELPCSRGQREERPRLRLTQEPHAERERGDHEQDHQHEQPAARPARQEETDREDQPARTGRTAPRRRATSSAGTSRASSWRGSSYPRRRSSSSERRGPSPARPETRVSRCSGATQKSDRDDRQREHDDRCGQDAAHPSGIEVDETDLRPARELAEQVSGDQESGDDEEDVDADVPARDEDDPAW